MSVNFGSFFISFFLNFCFSILISCFCIHVHLFVSFPFSYCLVQVHFVSYLTDKIIKTIHGHLTHYPLVA
uniref:Uncharacterized protein n=1 Tax=Rhizophora mucronata TaxID=61149 RepID=A0A2P2P720_RHIMU